MNEIVCIQMHFNAFSCIQMHTQCSTHKCNLTMNAHVCYMQQTGTKCVQNATNVYAPKKRMQANATVCIW